MVQTFHSIDLVILSANFVGKLYDSSKLVHLTFLVYFTYFVKKLLKANGIRNSNYADLLAMASLLLNEI